MNSNNKTGFTLEKLLEQVYILMEFELKRSKCKLNKTLEIPPDTFIDGDMVSLTQILNNIVINAIQSYKDGGPIDLIIKEFKKGIQIIIKDYGRGISEDVLNNLFHKMTTTKGSGGSGLGLYLANIAIKGQFNGHINIESEINKGTTVYISFPSKQFKNTN